MAKGEVYTRQDDGAYHFASQDELDGCVRGTRRSKRILYAVGAAFALGALASVANMDNGKRSVPFAILVTVVSAALAVAFVGLARIVGRDFLDAVDNHPEDVKVDGTSGTAAVPSVLEEVSRPQKASPEFERRDLRISVDMPAYDFTSVITSTSDSEVAQRGVMFADGKNLKTIKAALKAFAASVLAEDEEDPYRKDVAGKLTRFKAFNVENPSADKVLEISVTDPNGCFVDEGDYQTFEEVDPDETVMCVSGVLRYKNGDEYSLDAELDKNGELVNIDFVADKPRDRSYTTIEVIGERNNGVMTIDFSSDVDKYD